MKDFFVRSQFYGACVYGKPYIDEYCRSKIHCMRGEISFFFKNGIFFAFKRYPQQNVILSACDVNYSPISPIAVQNVCITNI